MAIYASDSGNDADHAIPIELGQQFGLQKGVKEITANFEKLGMKRVQNK